MINLNAETLHAALSPDEAQRTSLENVQDVLAAMHRIITKATANQPVAFSMGARIAPAPQKPAATAADLQHEVGA